MDSHVIYATSVSNMDLFPNNEPSAFENRLYNQLALDSKRTYEMCLQNILLPSAYYVIRSDDLESYIRVRIMYLDAKGTMSYKHSKFLPKTNILAGSIK